MALPPYGRSGPIPDMPHPAQRYRAPGPEPARLRRSVFGGALSRALSRPQVTEILRSSSSDRDPGRAKHAEESAHRSRLGLWWALGDLDNRDDIPRERVYRGISSFTARLDARQAPAMNADRRQEQPIGHEFRRPVPAADRTAPADAHRTGISSQRTSSASEHGAQRPSDAIASGCAVAPHDQQ